jgi:hypothetical protein
VTIQWRALPTVPAQVDGIASTGLDEGDDVFGESVTPAQRLGAFATGELAFTDPLSLLPRDELVM